MVNALAKLNQVRSGTAKQILEIVLEEIIRLTQSKIGYVAVMNDAEDELTMIGWSKNAMDNCKMINKSIVYSLKETGLWGDAVRERKPIITNDYANLVKPTKKGYPPGHVEVHKHMNAPIIDGKNIVAVVGVGNKASDYNQADASVMTKFMGEAWTILKNKI